MKDNVIANFVVGGLSTVAFILLIKAAGEWLPESGFGGTLKGVIRSV